MDDECFPEEAQDNGAQDEILRRVEEGWANDLQLDASVLSGILPPGFHSIWSEVIRKQSVACTWIDISLAHLALIPCHKLRRQESST